MLRIERLLILAGMMWAASLMGCGSDSPAKPAAQTTPTSVENAGSKSGGISDTSQLAPTDVVKLYLSAVKEGDEKTVTSLLTETARRKTTELNIAVAPQGSETAAFSVGNMEYITEAKDQAHVASMWTDVNEQGKEQTLPIVWWLRHEPAGWRLAGMVTRLGPDKPRVELNFEDPEEVIRRQTAAKEEQTPGQDKGQVVAPSQAPGTQPPPSSGNQGAPANPRTPVNTGAAPGEGPVGTAPLVNPIR